MFNCDGLVISLLVLDCFHCFQALNDHEHEHEHSSKLAGKSPVLCDDGQTGIHIDLHGAEDWNCTDVHWTVDEIIPNNSLSSCNRSYGGHVCIQKQIDSKYPPNEIPNSGFHRPNWAVYGEYRYVPPGRYVHNLEHGAVVFMYHPCAPTELVKKLRYVAKTCTWKHLLTAYPKLDKQYPLAVVTYGCVYKMSSINIPVVREWIRRFGRNTSEANVNSQGTYDYDLVEKSKKPDSFQTEPFCPDSSSDKEWTLLATEETTAEQGLHTITDPVTSPVVQPTTVSKSSGTSAVTDEVVVQSHVEETPTSTPRTEEAAWAIGSLLFLFTALGSAMWCTKMWKTSRHSSTEKAKIWSDDNAPGSISVAAIVRKFPHVFSKKYSTPRSASSTSLSHYTLIEDDESASDEEL